LAAGLATRIPPPKPAQRRRHRIVKRLSSEMRTEPAAAYVGGAPAAELAGARC